MASFVAFNVEPEDDSEDEVDESKEIQIEEALKLYQAALKLHSQGPEFYDEAAIAYNKLFSSEIFAYPESLPESYRYSDIEIYEGNHLASRSDSTIGIDGTPSTLPQILYLSYKNHGQFLLDRFKDCIQHNAAFDQKGFDKPDEVSRAVRPSLQLFVEALGRNDTDMELWRQVSRISECLGSKRVARYCLEAVLDTDQSGLEVWSDSPGIDQTFAIEQLKTILQQIRDYHSGSPIAALHDSQKTIAKIYSKHIDPYPYLPSQQTIDKSKFQRIATRSQTELQAISVPLRSWASCGKSIMAQICKEEESLVDVPHGRGFCLLLPPQQISNTQNTTRLEKDHLDLSGKCTADQDLQVLKASTQQTSIPLLGHHPNGRQHEEPITLKLSANRNNAKQALQDESPNSLSIGNRFAEDSSFGSDSKSKRVADDNHNQVLSSPGSGEKDNLISPEVSMKVCQSNALPTRKRSPDSAGLQDNADIGRSRSKRIKARGSMTEPNLNKETSTVEQNQLYEDQLQIRDEADHWLFEALGRTLSRFNTNCHGSLIVLKQAVSKSQSTEGTVESVSSHKSTDTAARDLDFLLSNWDIRKSQIILSVDDANSLLRGSIDPGDQRSAKGSGLALFLELSKRESEATSQKPIFSDDENIEEFLINVRQNWTSLDQLAMKWIQALLGPRSSGFGKRAKHPSTYQEFHWSEDLKDTMVQMLVMKDEFVYLELCNKVRTIDQHLLQTISCERSTEFETPDEDTIETIQTIFELHLDIYSRIINPSSAVDGPTRILQCDRLGRWAALANEAISKKAEFDIKNDSLDSLAIRYLWSAALHARLVDKSSREYVILCFQDLKHTFRDVGIPNIELPNNALMSEISYEAAEREISSLTTEDFFSSLFSAENSSALTVIEILEPILEKSIWLQKNGVAQSATVGSLKLEEPELVSTHLMNGGSSEPDIGEFLSHQSQQTVQFIDRASVSLKFILWEKLRQAYEAINYPPQVLSCILRSIQIITNYLQSSSFSRVSQDARHVSLLRWIRTLGQLIKRALLLVLEEPNIFEIINQEHLHSSMESIAALQKIMYIQVFWEDSIQFGQAQPSKPKSSPESESFDSAMAFLQETLVRTWLLQYSLLKEAFAQDSLDPETSKNDLLDYLKLLHHAFGLRKFCKVSGQILPLFMKNEFRQLGLSVTYETDMAQVVYDLYGLKLCSQGAPLEEHGCPPAPLDCKAAIEIMDLVMMQVNRFSVKDLGKSELRSTIEKMQDAIKVPKPTPGMMFNRRIVNNFLKSPINPVDLYRSLRGIGSLNGTVANYFSDVGEKGWYFLLGHLTLTRFRSQKRLSAGPIDDLEIAIAFFKQELELGLEKWESWYRLAQAFDAKIEEDLTWTAEKLNNNMRELIILQRNAIHCYTMAVAIASQNADASFETVEKISELYSDFAIRVYSSSREPLSMNAFSLQDYKKHYNGELTGMYESHPFRPMQLYPAWKFACALLRRASIHMSESWMISYMLGKCLWKMHNCSDELRGKALRVSYDDALNAFKRAIELLPERRDNKHPGKDPTLEPHYKLISIIHKLVQSRRIQPEEGCKHLKATCYARKVSPVQDVEMWEGYIIRVLRSLRSADKANWHHRMVARAAHIIYDDSPNDIMAVLGAKHELASQMFTKTMHTQIWRPDNERPGRHFVYTSRYVSFFVRILFQLNDRSSLEALARRIRKRPGDFFNHGKIWEEACVAYLKLLRRHGSILEGNEDVVFKTLPHTNFLLNADRLEAWAHTAPTSPILDLLRETIELKKLNSNLMKSGAIEDLIGDTYAHLYERVVPDLVAKSNTEENRVRMRVDHLLMDTSHENPSPDDKPSNLITAAAPKQPRLKSISRREIQRKAEALVLAKAVPPPPSSNLSSAPANPKVLTTVEISGRERDPSGQSLKISAILAIRENEDAGRDISSAAGSVHDSADDESELSEVDEKPNNGGLRVLFPGLVGARDKGDDDREEEGGKDVDDKDEEEDVTGDEERLEDNMRDED